MSKREEERRARLKQEELRRRKENELLEVEAALRSRISKCVTDAAKRLDDVALALFSNSGATVYRRSDGPPRSPGAVQVTITANGKSRELTKAEHKNVYKMKFQQLESLLKLGDELNINMAKLIERVDSERQPNDDDAAINLLLDMAEGEPSSSVIKDISLLNGGLPLRSIRAVEDAILIECGLLKPPEPPADREVNWQATGPGTDSKQTLAKKPKNKKAWTTDCDRMKKAWFSACKRLQKKVPRFKFISQELKANGSQYPGNDRASTMDKRFQNNPEKWKRELSELLKPRP